MKVTTHAFAAAKAIKSLDKLKLDPTERLAVLRTAANLLENEIECAAFKLSLLPILEG